jgi:hypothetical protein
VKQRRCRNQTVLDGHGLARGPKVGKQFGPAQSCGGVPRYTKNFRGAFPEPAFQALTPFAGGEKKNAEPDFSKDERIHSNLTFVLLQPFEHTRIGRWLGGLAEHISIHQVGQSVSVDSDSMATKNPLSGQASSQSTRPWFGRGLRRTSRYSPRSTRSTSNACPASMPSRWRNSAGSTIWPLVETVVFTENKIPSYSDRVKGVSPSRPGSCRVVAEQPSKLSKFTIELDKSGLTADDERDTGYEIRDISNPGTRISYPDLQIPHRDSRISHLSYRRKD